MANLNVTYQDMHQQATNLRTGQTDITERLHNLQSQIDTLVSSGFVTSSASGAFQSTYQQFTTGAQQTISALDQLASMLANAATTLEQTDAQLAQQMGN